MLKGLFNRAPAKALAELAAPWAAGHVSWYDRIAAAIARRGTGLGELDLAPPYTGLDPRVQPGGMDAWLNDPHKSPSSPRVRALLGALKSLVKQPSDEAFARFYTLALEPGAINVADPLRWACREIIDERDKIVELARRIVREAPDAEPVKIALPLLAFSPAPADRELIVTLGAYDEFTPYAIDAVRLSPNKEADILALAKAVNGWGRIQASHWFTETTDPAIKDWLLRQAHRNTVMAEENALLCATSGGLLAALSGAAPDDDMLDAAGELIRAILLFWDASGAYDYTDGPEVCARYLEIVKDRPKARIQDLFTAVRILQFLEETKADWDILAAIGWSPAARDKVRDLAMACLSRPDLPGLIEYELRVGHKIYYAWCVAERIGLDAWPHLWERSQDGEDLWFELMLTDKVERIEQVLALAAERLDLVAVGSGPGLELIEGPDYDDDRQVAIILQEMGLHPVAGWPFVENALRGRAIQVRFLAARTLHRWGADAWTPPMRPALSAARDREPDKALRGRMDRVLKGLSPDEA